MNYFKHLICLSFQGVGNATACVMGEKIYVSGGHHGYRGNCTYEKIQVYRSDVNEWSVLTVAPHPGMKKKERVKGGMDERLNVMTSFLSFQSMGCAPFP